MHLRSSFPLPPWVGEGGGGCCHNKGKGILWRKFPTSVSSGSIFKKVRVSSSGLRLGKNVAHTRTHMHTHTHTHTWHSCVVWRHRQIRRYMSQKRPMIDRSQKKPRIDRSQKNPIIEISKETYKRLENDLYQSLRVISFAKFLKRDL